MEFYKVILLQLSISKLLFMRVLSSDTANLGIGQSEARLQMIYPNLKVDLKLVYLPNICVM